MTRTNFVISNTLLLFLVVGCKATSERMNEAAEHPNATAQSSGGLDVVENPNAPQTDNAEGVLASCGRPAEDQVLAIYNKTNQGPIRRMVYRQRRVVTVEFIPSHPIDRLSARQHLTAQLPAGSVWRFDVAHVPKEIDMVTADRMQLFLPCAAKALRSEF